MQTKSKRYWKCIWLTTICMVLFLSAYGVKVYATDSTISVKVVGKSWYGAAKLMIEEINQLRRQNGVPALTLDADLQEWATQMSAEMLFYPDMVTSDTRPDGSSIYSLPTKPIVDICSIGISAISNTDENRKFSMSSMYKTHFPWITNDSSYKSIGIGLYQEKSAAESILYGVILLGSDNIKKGAFKSTIETEVRTINTLSSNFKLCNGEDRNLLIGNASDKIDLYVGESFTTSPYQHLSDGSHVKIESTQLSLNVKDPTISSALTTPDGIKVTGLKPGHTTFTATLYGQTVTYDVTVNDKQDKNNTTSKKPNVKKLKDLPKDYQGSAIVDGEEVYVKNQKKATGNVTSGGVTYYYKNGKKASGNVKIDGVTYYYKNGVKFTGTKGAYYYKSGRKYTGWLKKKGKKYYYFKGKLVKNKFRTIKGKKYYFNKKGIMQKGQIKVKGKYYYFNKSGVMQKNKWIKIKKYKYYFNKEGVRTRKRKI